MSQLLGCAVHVRGNQLFIESDSHKDFKKLESIIQSIEEIVEEGKALDESLVSGVIASYTQESFAGFKPKNSALFIPQGYEKVYPRTKNQSLFLEALSNFDLVFGIGPAGTGKTFLAIAHALSEILAHKKKKLILTRPVVEAGESLGFLPGDLEQKLNPYVKPLYDAMDFLVPGEVISKLEELRVIEIAPLAYMRGRSLRDSYVVLDEAQNTTREQMKMFLTRMGENTKMVITGDITQIDLPSHKGSGLIHAQTVLKDIPEVHFARFETKDVVRSPLVKKIIGAYEAQERI